MTYSFRLLTLALALLALSGCAGLTRFSHQNASGYSKLSREECVPYTRRVSGIQIYGNANTWWDQAAGRYARGNLPAPGAVLALKQTNRLRNGHVAVVAQVLSPRAIKVTHTNWGNDWMSRRVVYETHRVQDISQLNDWTLVRFWNDEAKVYGAPYPAHGFIYKTPAPPALPAPYTAQTPNRFPATRHIPTY